MEKLKPLWLYKQDDITTWKYLYCVIAGNRDNKTRFVKEWIFNPDFAFKDIDKKYNLKLCCNVT